MKVGFMALAASAGAILLFILNSAAVAAPLDNKNPSTRSYPMPMPIPLQAGKANNNSNEAPVTSPDPRGTPFSIYTNYNIPTDYRRPERNLGYLEVPGSTPQQELEFCKQSCERNAQCEAFTLEKIRVGTTTAICRLISSRIVFDNPFDFLVPDQNKVSGIRNFTNTPCWAREGFNMKFCNVVTDIRLCPPDSTEVRSYRFNRRNQPYARQDFSFACVWRRDNDPGGLPNCTDRFGSAENGGDWGTVNRACLDAN